VPFQVGEVRKEGRRTVPSGKTGRTAVRGRVECRTLRGCENSCEPAYNRLKKKGSGPQVPAKIKGLLPWGGEKEDYSNKMLVQVKEPIASRLEREGVHKKRRGTRSRPTVERNRKRPYYLGTSKLYTPRETGNGRVDRGGRRE